MMNKISFLILLATIISCKTDIKQQTTTNSLAKVITVIDSSLVYPAIFEAAFNKIDTPFIYKTDTLLFSKYELGLLTIASGKIVVCDPIFLGNYPSLADSFLKGRFPVQLARLGSSIVGKHTAFARLKFS